MAHDHHHHHHHTVNDFKSINRAFIIGIGLNVLFTVIEFIVGFYSNSLALLSDASHNLSDVASLLLSLIGLKLAQKAVTLSYTYGYKKATILASFFNSLMLVIVVIGIIREAVERFVHPPEISGLVIIIVAAIGVIINSISALLCFKDQKSDINIKGAFMHLLVDALVSVGVVISGIVMIYSGWSLIDPIISIVIAGAIIFSTWGLLVESIRLTLDAVPKDIDVDKIITKINTINGVKDIHHVHVWAISSTLNAMTAHISIDSDSANDSWENIKQEIKHILEHHNISHSTLELETVDVNCHTEKCC